MRALVTGGAGFIGSHICQELLSRGHFVLAVDNLTNGRLENFEDFDTSKNFEFQKTDILNRETLFPIFKEIDWVFHMAGLADIVPSIEKPALYFDVNVKGTLNVLEASKEAGVKRFTYAASSSSYGIPETYPTPESSPILPQYPYALTKYLGEELVLHWAQTYKLPAVSLRLFNVYGPRSRTTGTYGAVFGVFLAQKLNKKPYTVVGDGNQTRDFTYVTDVADAFILAAESDLSDEFINVGSGNTYSVNRLVELLGGDVEYIPKRPGEPDCTFADVSKIERLLGWKAKVRFEQGVQNMVEKIENWEAAPVWNSDSIQKATSTWFKFLGDNSKT
ncbi:MAG: NAD-dependent dehydratase [Nitrospina sp.]|nr:NAD-dependent dehydratase [Nitrospina sp.]|tara:strand:+ start:6569 stop:7567 length:999 start_codon:yes stop_codon:yes gene_type:complete